MIMSTRGGDIIMKFVNRNQLEVEMTKLGLKTRDLAEELCITYSGAYEKVKGRRNFNEHEICVLARLFGTSIFFLDCNTKKKRNE